MKKYKITSDYLNEFFGLFKKSTELKKKPTKHEKMQRIIDNDPILKKLDAELDANNREAAAWIKKDPEMLRLFKKYGFKVD